MQQFAAPARPRRIAIADLAPVFGSLAIAVELLVSGNLLIACGIPYAAEGGNPLEKLHPGTYLAGVAFVLLLLRERNPLRGLWRTVAAAPAPAAFAAAMLLCFAWSAATTGKGHLIVYLENFLPAGLLALVFQQASPRALRRLAMMVIALLVLNVFVSFAEAALQRHFVPLYLDDREYQEVAGEFRPTALYDHPLTGAMLTMIGVFLVAEARGPVWLRAALHGLLLLGLVSFGGRAALVLSVALLLGWQGWRMLRRLLTRQLTRYDLLAILALLTIVPALLALVLSETNIGERLAGHFYWDDSAEVRSIQWQIFGLLDRQELWFGMTLARQEAAVHQLGLTYPIGVIENFWLLLLTDLGILGFVIFLAGFAALLVWCWRQAPAAGKLMLLGVLLAASGSNSLGRKANLLSVLVPAVLATRALAEPPPGPAAALPRPRSAAPADRPRALRPAISGVAR